MMFKKYLLLGLWAVQFWCFGVDAQIYKGPDYKEPVDKTSTPVAHDYALGAGDVIEINVYQQADFKSLKTLSNTGEIRVPIVGVVNLAGKTQRQAERLLASRLRSSRVINDPDVSVRIVEYRSSVASVDGTVAKPGEYPVIGPLTIHQLISRAGGLKEGASPIVTLYRANQALRKIDLYDIYRTDRNVGSYAVRPGDRVLVEMDDLELEEQVPVFYTYGEVTNNGSYELTDGMTVIQALATSGGLTESALRKKIEIIRVTDAQSGATETIRVSLTDKVQANDVIKIDGSRF